MGRAEQLKTLERMRLAGEIPDNSLPGYFDRMTAPSGSTTGSKDYMALVDEAMKADPKLTKAQAMRQVHRQYPEAHAVWLKKINQR
jgi:hypothetical protein